MKIQPLRKYRNPNYPMRIDVTIDKTLLARHVPPAWKKTAQLAGIAALMLGSNGCSIGGKPAVVAPIFEHGEGRGGVGCMMVTSPVFLSEEEALQVIRDELENKEIVFSATETPLRSVKVRTQEETYVKEKRKLKKGKALPFHCDIFDASNSIAVEFVSTEEYFQLGGKKTSYISWQDYELKDIAKELSKNIKKNGRNVRAGVFYDPIRYVDKDKFKIAMDEYEKERKELREKYGDNARYYYKEAQDRFDEKRKKLHDLERIESKRLLRLQVADFVEWLKGQGVI